jgi:hypothetical protein
MRLVDLDPEWVTYGEHGGLGRYGDMHSHVAYHPDSLGEVDSPDTSIAMPQADGVMFLCPTCFKKNGGAIGTERVVVWFRDRAAVPADALPGPGRWVATGDSFDDLTLQPSVNVDHEHWHGFVRAGEIA